MSSFAPLQDYVNCLLTMPAKVYWQSACKAQEDLMEGIGLHRAQVDPHLL